MTDEILEEFTRQYIEAQTVPEVVFGWQGGEPTLMGLDFFRRAVALQERYRRPGMRILNALQTNGTLLDDEWCIFLRQHDFLVGLSLDGPQELHDHYRRDRGNKPTFSRVMRALHLLQKHRVEFNVLTVVNRVNADHPHEVYDFLKGEGVQFIQFIPAVAQEPGTDGRVTEWTVRPKQYGRFLSAVFDEWVRYDVGEVFVQHFDVALGCWMGMESSLCIFSRKCGNALAMEHNGDLYSCDHFVFPEYFLGNIRKTPLRELVASAFQRGFGSDKYDRLPRFCRECPFLFACNGACPKDRFVKTPDGEDGLNYLCAGYKEFFNHIDPYMRMMAEEVRMGRPASNVMERLKGRGEEKPDQKKVGRNDPCPCGSGKKYKHCCLRKETGKSEHQGRGSSWTVEAINKGKEITNLL